MKPTLLASASTLEGIKALVERRYYGPKELIPVSEKEYYIQGNRDGKPYLHQNERVIIVRGRYRHEKMF